MGGYLPVSDAPIRVHHAVLGCRGILTGKRMMWMFHCYAGLLEGIQTLWPPGIDQGKIDINHSTAKQFHDDFGNSFVLQISHAHTQVGYSRVISYSHSYNPNYNSNLSIFSYKPNKTPTIFLISQYLAIYLGHIYGFLITLTPNSPPKKPSDPRL